MTKSILWCCAQNQTKNTRKICVWMPAILVVVKKYTSVVIRPISDPVARKRRNWSAIQNFMPAVGLLKLHTLFSIAFTSFWFALKRKLTIIWPSFNLPALSLSGVKSYASIVNFEIGSYYRAGIKDRQKLVAWQMERGVEKDLSLVLAHVTPHKLMRYIDVQCGLLQGREGEYGGL